MSADLQVPDDIAQSQRRAADPATFAWVSANAGAGKTKVLTDRVMRLLLEGSPPGRILCLTFTRAAAANMTARVFAELGRWVTLPDDALAKALHALEGVPPSPARIRQARRLFARAVETPGGLKIDTIHAFCERLLHLAPFEAGVPARFAVLDESQTSELMAEARNAVLSFAAGGAAGSEDLAAALETATAVVSIDGLTAALDCAVRDEGVPDEPSDAAAALGHLRHALGLGRDESEEAIETTILEGGLSAADRARLADILAQGSKTDRDQAELLRSTDAARERRGALDRYRAVFFNKGDGKPKARVATGAVDAAGAEALAAEQQRLVALFDRLQSARILARTAALFALASAVRRRFREAKGQRGVLDFDDLIERTLAVLGPESAAWILYKLDRGIDHVLIDEAQDTNPAQWRILQRITEDFTAGAGAGSARTRTLFAVGDPKQSIFSFQGADPRWFETSRRYWSGRASEAALAFSDIRLDVSFRSAPAILGAVDATFGVAAHYQGLSYADTAIGTSHRSARPTAAGHVEMWPIERKEPKAREPDAWSLPVDQSEPTSPPVKAAEKVARAIRHWVTNGDETGRIWNPSDILILSRKRGPAFFAVIRALRRAGVPVAGADRFDIGEHIAVLDLVAAGNAALLLDNDLALAAALKSPLVGLTDDDLMRFAAERPDADSLARSMRRHAGEGDAAARAGEEALSLWHDLARTNGPFGFYAALLGPQGARRRLISRLGGEAADAIDAFLSYAESAERGPDAPSLTGFLARFQNAAHTIKRDLEAGGDEVRVMTVHGAKGLEAGAVIILDGCDAGGEEPPLLPVAVGPDEAVPAWAPSKKQDCAATAAARLRRDRIRMDEHNRLLYVAMTRAKDRLLIAPFSTATGEPPPHSWCNMVRRGFEDAQMTPLRIEAAYGPTEIWRDEPRMIAPAAFTSAPADAVGLPDWLTSPVAADAPLRSALRASSAAPAVQGPAGRGRRADATARLAGTLAHALIERLPGIAPERRHEVAQGFMAARAGALPAEVSRRITAEALAVLAHPHLAPLFGPGSRGEVALSGEVRLAGASGPLAVSGQIDRLVVRDDAVLIADFKTGQPPAAGEPSPAAYLVQLALYRALLREMHPGRPVRCFLVWTSGPRVDESTADELDAALAALADEAAEPSLAEGAGLPP